MKGLLGEFWQSLKKSGKRDAAAKQTSVCSDKWLSAVWNSVPLSLLASLVLMLNEIMVFFYRTVFNITNIHLVFYEFVLDFHMFVKQTCHNVCGLCCKLDLLQSTSAYIETIALRVSHVGLRRGNCFYFGQLRHGEFPLFV